MELVDEREPRGQMHPTQSAPARLALALVHEPARDAPAAVLGMRGQAAT